MKFQLTHTFHLHSLIPSDFLLANERVAAIPLLLPRFSLLASLLILFLGHVDKSDAWFDQSYNPSLHLLTINGDRPFLKVQSRRKRVLLIVTSWLDYILVDLGT